MIRIVSLRFLAQGGNGDLWLGEREDTGESVAVKYLRERSSAYARRAFVREVKVLRAGAKGVVRLIHADLKGPHPYYVMPYFPGGSVAAHAGRLSGRQLVTVALDVTTALRDLHARWIVHGDVKPDNILVCTDGHLSVADPLGNGLGCTFRLSTNCGGTPGYWAPEVAAGSDISRAGDVYSFGRTLYHLATGRRPTDHEGVNDVRFRPGIPHEICEVILACCQDRPQLRPSMGDVLRMLRGERLEDIQLARLRAVLGWTAVGVTAVLLATRGQPRAA